MKSTKTISRFIGGISDFPREGVPDSYAFGRSIDVRSDPQSITILPRTIKESASVIRALPKWAHYADLTSLTYIYDEGGNMYSRDANGAYTYLNTAPNSHGNGMNYFGEDGSIYYTSDKVIGRYGPLTSSTPTFVNDYFGSQGGVALNTAVLQLLSASTQYASRADTASLSLTGDLSLEAQIKPTTLPTSGNTMTLISKWTENGNVRSYKFGIGTVSNYFGDGSDGALTISADTTEAPIDSACTGTINTYALSATNVSFAANQVILIHQTRGTGAGNWMKNTIQSYTAGTITLVNPLNAAYVSGAQVRVLKQYTNVTVNAGFVWSAKAWNGTVGGILAFLANGTITVNGTISAGLLGPAGGYSTNNQGFRGATVNIGQGEGTAGDRDTVSTGPNGSGGGGGNSNVNGAGGGGNASAGTNGTGATPGQGGNSSGSASLTTMTFGGGGGRGATSSGQGGYGGGIIFASGVTITVDPSTGFIKSNGSDGQVGSSPAGSGGGGGAGGSVLLKCQTATLGTGRILAQGGLGGTTGNAQGNGGAGSDGRIHIDYLTSYTGTTTPTIDTLQDSTLSSTSGYSLFLSTSNDGTAVQTLSKPVNVQTGLWQDVSVSFTSSTKTAEFFLNSVSQGTVVGTTGTIQDNASTFNVGMDRDSASNPQHLYNGLIDEARVYSTPLTAAQYFAGLSTQINAATTGLVAYYHFNSSPNDSTANANNLTLTGGPTYSIDVPYSSPTTRLDIDQTSTTSGNTYTTPTAISEASTDLKSFTPARDPQKSLAVYIAAKGTGNWTITVHDSNNNVIATSTVTNANLTTGLYEFTFSTPWRPLTNFTNTYHFHVTSTVADGTVQTTTAADLSTVTYTTYFQFLVSDTAFHPVKPHLQFLTFGNERHIGKLEAGLYNPNYISLPSGWNIRCIDYWNEYAVYGCTRGSGVTQQDRGLLVFWDGIETTYNFSVPVPEGGINALLGAGGMLYIWAGYQGDMLVYSGGSNCQRVKKMPKITTSTTTEIYPGAVTMWKGFLRFGSAGSTTSTTIQQGVYTFGKTNLRYIDALTYDYPISTGTLTGTSLRIGMVYPVNKKLLIGWQDGTGYGVDYVDDSNPCYPTATIECMIDDGNDVWKEKLGNTLVAKLGSLGTGQSATLRYLKDDDTVWTYGETTTSSSLDPTITRAIVTNGRFYEIQYGVDLASSTGVTPTLKGIGWEADNNQGERRV